MKKKYIILIITFIIVILSIITFFMIKNEKTIIKNKVNHILKTMYSISSGEYDFENGRIYNDRSYFVNDKYDIKGIGKIVTDKYHNVKLFIETKKYCISKTYMGNTKIERGDCKGFSSLDVEYVKNNNKVSFITNIEASHYMISLNDDFKGKWTSLNSKNLLLNSYNEGFNYIWFKDKDGNLSDVINFNVDCLYVEESKYDKNTFYCSGSKVIIDKEDWIVIKDNYNEISLIKNSPIKDKLSHTNNNYIFNKDNIYNWSNSYINYYLNNKYINTLSKTIKNSIKEKEICIDTNSKCDNESCIGYNKNDILNYNYTCNNYTKNKIRLISYEEYNYLFNNVNKNIIGNNIWMINSYENNKGSIIDINNDVYTKEELNSLNYIHPVITLTK